MRGIAVLGSTGSIGVSTLDVVAREPERYRVVALSANTDVDGLMNQIERFGPELVAMADVSSAEALRKRLQASGDRRTEVRSGPEGLEAVATHAGVDDVMAAIVGAAGLLPTLAAVRLGRRILLANKESLVVCGALFMQTAAESGAVILPIDSEHNAVFQCLPRAFDRGLVEVGVTQIVLTASGGPFREHGMDQLRNVTPEQACAHPNWDMGRKISVDSATMMNKGLEVIEAHWLFGAEPDQIEVVVHPQSIIHSMVRYVDGSILAQLGHSDMRVPIAHALAWPERHASGVDALDLVDIARLDFEAPDLARFPCLRLAFEAVRQGGTAPAVLNAANEVAVDRFLRRQLAFLDISRVVEDTMQRFDHGDANDLDTLLAADAEARCLAEQRADVAV